MRLLNTLTHSLTHSPVESASFFIPSTSLCSLSSWFTSFCAYRLTVTTFALTITLSVFHSRLTVKLIFFTNPFLHSHSYSFRTAYTRILNLYWALAFVCFSFLSSFSFFFLATCAGSSFISYRKCAACLANRIVSTLNVTTPSCGKLTFE